MVAVKVTFTLDEATVERLRLASARLARPKSAVVREAIADYSDRIGRLSEQERLRWLRAFDELVPRIPDRPRAEVQRELRAIRRARRTGGRAYPGPRRP
jgi:predicted transcriptional regulator